MKEVLKLWGFANNIELKTTTQIRVTITPMKIVPVREQVGEMSSFDLGAMVVRLQAAQAVSITTLMGRGVQSAFLSALDEPLAASIQPKDSSSDRPLPYTVSGIMADGKTHDLHGDISAGTPAWIRLTGLNRQTCAALEQFRQAPPAQLDIHQTLWDITSMTWDEAPWASTHTYRALMESAYTQPSTPDTLHLQFASPTTFRSSGSSVAAPIANLIFSNLADHWAAITGMPVRELKLWQAFTTYHISLVEQDIKPYAIKFKDGGKDSGFTGEALYEFKPQNSVLERENKVLEAEVRKDYDNLCRLAGMLADYAKYAGVGRKTTSGLGLCHRLG